jgi:CheY-like chemotaxis protein
MIPPNINILLADDDHADCLLFREALEELPIIAHLNIVYNGEELLDELTKKEKKHPNVIFLDLNMPRKNGFASLGQIKRSIDLQDIPVIIFSTAADLDTVKKVFRDAAHYYITKPASFLQLKKVIYEGLTLIFQKDNPLPGMEHFRITGDAIVIPEKK